MHDFTLSTLKVVTSVLVMALVMITPGLSAESLDPADHDLSASDVTVELAWARPALRGGNGAAYFIITNNGENPVTLVGAETPIANVVEIHQTVLMSDEELASFHEEHGQDLDHDHDHHHHHDHDHHHEHQHHDDHSDHSGSGGTFVMLHLSELQIDAGERVLFEPAGLHIMLINLTETLAWDSTFPLTLHFLEAEPITVSVTVGDTPEGW